MLRAAVFVTALSAAFLQCVVLGDADDDVTAELEIFDLEHDLYADQSHYEQHHRHHGHHRNPFLHHRASLLEDHPARAVPRDVLPGRNTAVAQKLHNMEGAMQDLSGRKLAHKRARDNLEGEVKKSVKHMNEVEKIKIMLAKTEVQIRSEQRKLRKLEEDRLRLDKTHVDLAASLHHIMEPKIGFADERLEKSQRDLRSLAEKANAWKSKEGQFHDASLAMLAERRQSKVHLEEAITAEEKAKQARRTAEKEFLGVKKDLNFDLQGYQFSKARAKAAESREERGDEIERQAEAAKKRLTRIYDMEQRHVDESMARGKDRVMGKIRELENAKKQSFVKLAKMRDEYAAWKDRQSEWATHVVSTKHSTNAVAKDYADAQQAMLGAAEDQVVHDAESGSDWAWDDWAMDGKSEGADA